ncbi:MAG: multifunctional oxoglutarate decarboxylase/oxoglutarate dehydrogenase thiamine pyrophosphate-binding subunit/dihydrolipoyllysine-residue succinyltransferase subunit, partial [Candidatus Eremiobacteraeota bacterium]|nr:multifunctional oxoglutarate decarboxylase/oxoglutarate dehydrogenase thiamine pyrophosphate-binding subunit/dihydrolipoyllysine-residue succinyltransferase subunit [Candidatus Eremiobacteraeota bacterium]
IGYMEQSLTIPTATSFRTLAVDVMDARRKEFNAGLKTAGRAQKISFTHLIAYALVRAANELPFISYSFRRENDKPARVEPGIHLGLAVDSQRKDGSRFLVVPVIKNAGSLDFASFHAKYEELVAKARDNKLVADDLQGASLTLTNPGGIGTVASIPRLMAGQGAILAAGAIGYPAGFAALDEKSIKALGIGKIMQMTSTYDHRVIQGAQSGEYLKRVDELLQGNDGFYDAVFAQLGLQADPVTALQTSAAPSIVAASAAKPVSAPSEEMLRAVAAGMAVVAAYRTHGLLAATLDPLGNAPVGDPSLEPANWGLTPALLAAIPASVLRVKVPGATLAEVLPHLKETYASSIAYEIEHISNTQQREWLRETVESGRHKVALTNERKLEFLRRLTRVEAFERYLRKAFLGQKTFSGEGLDIMIPMLEEILHMLAADGVSNAVLGMAHRGRLSIIAHVVNMPYEEIFAEFEAANDRSQIGADDVTGDVKYHHGATGVYEAGENRTIAVTLVNNPSHLETVDPVVEGRARALQTDHSRVIPHPDFGKAAPILIHGDAAFTGQGIVSEVFNLQSLPGYTTGGTLHIIANNQIGFTTDVRDARSTRYASDLSKGFDVPIVHVNADDVDGCVAAVHLAMDFRKKFRRDIVIDLIGYRRFGHNESDEPAYTQPEMYERIKAHPSVRELFANALIAQGVITSEQAAEMTAQAMATLQESHKKVKGEGHDVAGILAKLNVPGVESAPVAPVDKARLLAWSDELVTVPEGFTLNKKLQSQFERRKGVIRDKGLVDWGMSEALAFASLLERGTPVRISGQDTERGTFSHRHAVWHDPARNRDYVPMQHLHDAKASFEIHNSPLSEYACMGFEYGYSTAMPNALVLWEAQYGDFFNGAQIIVDQMIAAGQAKWGQTTRLTLLLPHGYEGGGPEHSSARLERFLQLTAEGNLRVANPSNAGNYYHLLRMQATSAQAVPLVVMTPKSLLRLEAAYGSIDDMSTSSFRGVLDDPRALDRDAIERVVLCTGKIYYDLIANDAYKKLKSTAIVRIEMLAPLPVGDINTLLATYPKLKKLVWVQEEPKNMGARAYIRRRLLEGKANSLDIEYIGRGYRASPSEGYPGAHVVEQERIVTTALSE